MEEILEEVKRSDNNIPIPNGNKTPHGGSRRPGAPSIYDFETRLKLVKLNIEDGHSLSSLMKEFGIGKSTLGKWRKSYLTRGEDGLKPGNVWYASKRKIAVPVKERIEKLKRENPEWGIKRISDVLKRIFMMGASPRTVRRVISESNLPDPNAAPAARRKRNITPPRFFERSTPNQMWQADIFTFHLGGRNAYLVGYVDDYSRYITGLGLYMSQTADTVLEVYRRAVTEYGVPKEMLTDNGRQYASWRGTTKFERELAKDHVRHIKSQPHHPMTKGKIERLWKSIHNEFLSRAQFETFESARERVAVWTERRNPAAVCRELSVKWTQLNMWQNQALEAMLRALDTGRSTERAMLGDRLERLLDRKVEPRTSRLEKRLDMISRKKGVQQENAPG